MTNLRELAIEALQARRNAIDAEIEELRGPTSGSEHAKPRLDRNTAVSRFLKSGKRSLIFSDAKHPRSPKSRKAQSEAMKRYWAKRKKGAK